MPGQRGRQPGANGGETGVGVLHQLLQAQQRRALLQCLLKAQGVGGDG
jgi:hypothetical protein